jgi:tight adherence protein C
MLLALALALLLASVFVIGEAVTLPARERRATLRRALARDPSAVEQEQEARFRERVLDPAAAGLARLALRLGPRTNVDAVRKRLAAAGVRGVTPERFLALKGAATVGGLLLGFLLGTRSGAGAAIGFALAFGFLGFVVPDFLLSSRARKRREAVQAELPDALDLLAVSVEAGLGFDAAMSRLTEHMRGALIEEFGLTLGEMRIGRSRHVALRGLAERIEAPELAAFVRAVVQADQLGMSLSKILKVQGEDSRRRRQAAAEERAMKAPVKMLFPTVLFIFPAMFIVILGPAILNFMEVF